MERCRLLHLAVRTGRRDHLQLFTQMSSHVHPIRRDSSAGIEPVLSRSTYV
jgi:hypothetical protein